MRSATAEPHVRAEAEALSAPETALVQYDAASGQENEEDKEEGGYRLTFNTSSVCFAGTGAQVDIHAYSTSCIPAISYVVWQKGHVLYWISTQHAFKVQ